MGTEKKKRFKMPTAFTVLLLIIAILAIITSFINNPMVRHAKLPDFVMAPINGFSDALWVELFVFVLGGFLGIMTKTGALELGIKKLVFSMHGKEMMLIPILMIIFSIGGTTFGMAEESLAFYALITATMMFAGFDPLVGAATVLLGAGTGVLGSTVNPFVVSVAIDTAARSGVSVNQSIIIGLGAILWLTSVSICIFFVMRYAKKIHDNKGNSLLSYDELESANKKFEKTADEGNTEFTIRHKFALAVFVLAFVIMIIGSIPWKNFGINIFDNSTAWLTGLPLGKWYFKDICAWFLICAVAIGLIFGFKEHQIVNAFISGASDMMGVALVIAVSRGISILMRETGLDIYILDHASNALKNLSPAMFTILSYFIYLGLSVLIPSTSGLATGSMGVFAPLAVKLGLSADVIIMIFSASCGLVNLVTPTSGVVMGGLSIARIEYTTWIKFVFKVLLVLIAANLAILSIAMIILR